MVNFEVLKCITNGAAPVTNGQVGWSVLGRDGPTKKQRTEEFRVPIESSRFADSGEHKRV